MTILDTMLSALNEGISDYKYCHMHIIKLKLSDLCQGSDGWSWDSNPGSLIIDLWSHSLFHQRPSNVIQCPGSVIICRFLIKMQASGTIPDLLNPSLMMRLGNMHLTRSPLPFSLVHLPTLQFFLDLTTWSSFWPLCLYKQASICMFLLQRRSINKMPHGYLWFKEKSVLTPCLNALLLYTVIFLSFLMETLILGNFFSLSQE